MESKKERTPVIEQEIALAYSKGLYHFYCKNIARLFVVVYAILKSAAESIYGSAAGTLVRAIWVVHHKARKLAGIDSISSSVHDNCFCAMWRKTKDCICVHCYAHNQQAFQTGLREHNILNGIILRNVLIPVHNFRIIKLISKYLRIESFGDAANVIQARNYIRIIKAFPEKTCAIWSKNLAIWAEAFRLEGKPENTTFVASSPYINKPISTTILENFPFVDHVFTVYEKKYAKEHNITINCGGRKCMDCLLKKINCYYRTDVFYINELLK